MAKQRHSHHEKVVIKSVNIACLLIALVLTALTVFAFTTLTDGLELNGISAETPVDEILDVIEGLEDVDNDTMGTVIPYLISFFLYAFLSIFTIVIVINEIRLIIGWFGFIGKKDSRKMAKKLSKHAKIAFGSIGIVLTLHVVCSLDNGVFADNFKTLALLTGIVFGVLFLAVRYYRWFVVEQWDLADWIIALVRDLMIVALPIVFLFMFPTVAPIGDFFTSFVGAMSMPNGVDSNFLMMNAVSKMFGALIEIVILLGVLGVMRKVVKFAVFDNYRKPVGKTVRGKFILTIILVALFGASIGLMESINVYQTFDVNVILPYLLNYKDVMIQLLAATIGMFVLAGIGNEEYESIKLAGSAVKSKKDEEEEDVLADSDASVDTEA